MNVIKIIYYHGHTILLLAGNYCCWNSLLCTNNIITHPINFNNHMTLYYNYDSKNKKQKHSCFIAHAQMSLWSIMETEKSRGELWEGRVVDGKLKSSLEWPNYGG